MQFCLLLCKAIVAGEDLRKDEVLEKHADWVDELKEKYTFTAENVEEILKKEIGIVFKKVLEHADDKHPEDVLRS